jgi:hypothetical protein
MTWLAVALGLLAGWAIGHYRALPAVFEWLYDHATADAEQGSGRRLVKVAAVSVLFVAAWLVHPVRAFRHVTRRSS